MLAATYGQIRQRLRRYQAAMSRVPHLPRTSIAEHAAILDAIAESDAAKASALSIEHLESLVRQFSGGTEAAIETPRGGGGKTRSIKGRKTR